MSKSFCLLGLVLGAALLATAQKTILYTVNPGQKPIEIIPYADQYRNETFQPGLVYYKSGGKGNGLLNYSYLFGEMMFANAPKDTMALANDPPVSQIVTAGDTFYFDKVYLRHLAMIGKTKLAVSEFFGISNTQKVGAMGTATDASVDSYRSISTATGMKELVVQNIIKLKKYTVLYVGDEFNNFEIANRKTLPVYFRGKSGEIRDFLKANAINFNSEPDIAKFMAFLKAL